MHIGRTQGAGRGRPFIRLEDGRDEGAVSADGLIAGCYLHGLFAADGFRHAFLSAIRRRPASGVAYEAEIEAVLDSLAAHLSRHLDLDRILEIARGR
jgi:adenosylcobyric acid synthase